MIIPYKFVGEATTEYLLSQGFCTEAVFLINDLSDETPMIVEYNCPRCGITERTVWVFPSIPMIFDNRCCGVVLEFMPGDVR